MSKIVVWGYYGNENFGDDIMLYNIVEYLHGENDLHIITSDIDKTKIPNVKKVKLYETYKSKKIQNLKLFFRIFSGKDFLIWGGRDLLLR